jgi:hypothetical protein
MAILVVHHAVRDFDAWKAVFDEHEEVRRRHGARRHWLYRDPLDGNDLVVAVEFPDPGAARAFLDDPSLADAMARAGVVGEPQVHVREEVETVDYGAAGAR